jgi:uncharacterized protein (DUF58 family)
MLRDAWPLITIALIIAGFAAGNGAVVALGIGVGIACYGAQLWARWSLRRLTYERVVPEERGFSGERLGLSLRITNNKPLPLPWIDTRERFPDAMVPPESDEFAIAGQVTVAQTDWRTSVGAHQRVSRSYELKCPGRGVYEIGPARVRSGDMFGLFTEERIEDRRTRIIVYPRTVDLGDLALPARRPHGEEPRGMRMFEDPSRVAGVRDYAPGDSLRRIDWNATARIGRLQSRVYDPSSSQHLLLCLNTQTVEPSWAGYVPDVLERSLVVAASIARDAYDRRYSVGLLANGSFPEADRSIRIAPGRRHEQFLRILEALAIVTPFVLEPLAAMIDREEHKLVLGTTVAVITGIMPQPLASTLLRLKRRGHAVVVLSTSGATWPDQLGDIEVRDLSHIEDVWSAPV